VATLWNSIGLVLWMYYILVVARLVVEITRQFARTWRPAGLAAIGVEAVYVSTDPPLRAIRKVCPPVRIGTVSLDLSVMILLLAILALRTVASYLAN
jgi:YggT family protein